MKFYSCHSLSSNYDIALNHIFYSDKFRFAYTAKFRFCPSGLTMECCTDEEDKTPVQFAVYVKKYGYESLSNNGFEYSDMMDYEIDYYNDNKLTEEQKEFCVEYIKEVDPELYETVKRVWESAKH